MSEGLTLEQVDARIRELALEMAVDMVASLVEPWAIRDNMDQIPAHKLLNSTDLVR